LRLHRLTAAITRHQLRKTIMDKGKVERLVDRWRRQWRRQRLILQFLDLFWMRQSYNLMGRVLQQWQHSIVMKQIYLESREEAAEAAAWWLSKQSTLQDAFQHWRTVVARLRSRYTRIHRFMHRRLLALSSRHLRQERMRAQSRSEKILRRGSGLNPVFLHVCKFECYTFNDLTFRTVLGGDMRALQDTDHRLHPEMRTLGRKEEDRRTGTCRRK
jgi:hypothetical protein